MRFSEMLMLIVGPQVGGGGAYLWGSYSSPRGGVPTRPIHRNSSSTEPLLNSYALFHFN